MPRGRLAAGDEPIHDRRMPTSLAQHRPPSKLLWAAELPRAAWTVISWPRHRTKLAGAPRGDGHVVVVLPGLLNTDRSTFVLRRFLRRIGYDAHGWGLGRNFGARTVGSDAEELISRLETLAAENGSGSAWAESSPG